MSANGFVALTVFVVIGMGLAAGSIPMLMGKGAFLVAGYSTMSPEERASWDGPALAKFTGKILLFCGIATVLYGVGLIHFGMQWLTWVYLAAVVGLCIFAVVWCNTGRRFRK